LVLGVFTGTENGMANIKDVAKKAGVSVATVSRVLSAPSGSTVVRSETVERVLNAAAVMNYRGNYHVAAMRRGRADVIGFALHFPRETKSDDAGRWYFDELRDGIESAVNARGVSVMGVRPMHGDSALEHGAKLVNKRQLDALIVPGHMAHFRTSDELVSTSAQLPLVVVDAFRDVGRPAIHFDAMPGIRSALQHLQALGHRKLLWVGPPDSTAANREFALLQAAWDLGLAGVTCRSNAPVSTGVGLQELYETVERDVRSFLRERPRDWSAVVAYSDMFAIGALRALVKENLRVPADVSVIGFDDSLAANCTPSLTTISHRLFEMGRAAGEMALRVFEADADGRTAMRSEVQTIPGELIVRESTGPAPAV
jgi:DNA-binding LacI/PurR family transcriptional regulator